jgi:hypothetical protein
MKFMNRLKVIWLIILLVSGAHGQNHLQYVSSSLFHDYFVSVVSSGNYIYCGGENGIQIFDAADPSDPEYIGNIDTASVYQLVMAEGNDDSLLFAFGGNLMQIFDISNGASPILVGDYATIFGSIKHLIVKDTMAYIVAESTFMAYNSYIQTINISDPGSPGLIDYAPARVNNYGMEVDSDFIYVLYSYDLNPNGMQIFGVNDYGYIYLLCDYDFGYDTPSGLSVDGNYAYIAIWSGISIFNIEDRTNPILEGTYNLEAYDIYTRGVDLYASGGSTIHRLNISDPVNLVYLSSYNTANNIEDFYLCGDTLSLVGSNGNYINTSALRIIDYSDSLDPVQLGLYDVPGDVNGLKLYGNIALVANGLSGIRPINITDPYNPLTHSNIETGGDAVDIAISENYAYVASYDAGLLIYDISDPENPVFAGSYDTSNATISICARGDYAYLINAREGVYDYHIVILNITDPSYPVSIRVYEDLYLPRYINVVDSIAYISCLYSLEIVNVADASLPVHLASHPYRYTGNNLFVEGNYAYVAGSPHGLDIFDISDPENPYIIGSFDSLAAFAVSVSNGFACLSRYNEIYLLDVSDPTNPLFIDSYTEEGARNAVCLREEYIYVPVEDYFLILKITPTGFEFVESVFPSSVSLLQNYPNPFNSATTITFTLPEPQNMRLTIYDLLGRQVRTLIDECTQAGAHAVIFDASDLSSGVYFYRLQAGDRSETKKMILLK